jgi:hypothetical protein
MPGQAFGDPIDVLKGCWLLTADPAPWSSMATASAIAHRSDSQGRTPLYVRTRRYRCAPRRSVDFGGHARLTAVQGDGDVGGASVDARQAVYWLMSAQWRPCEERCQAELWTPVGDSIGRPAAALTRRFARAAVSNS